MADPTTSAADFVAILVERRIPIDDLEPEDRNCSICKDRYTEMVPADEPVRLTCSHVFGLACLSRWLLEYGNSCPACRHPLHASDTQTEHEDEDEDDYIAEEELRRIIAQYGHLLDADDVLGMAKLEMDLYYNVERPSEEETGPRTYWWGYFVYDLFSEQARVLTFRHHRLILLEMERLGADDDDIDQYLRNLQITRPEFFPSMRA